MKGILIETPNKVIIAAVVIKKIGSSLLCYAQNRLFTVYEPNEGELYYEEVVVEYCVIPEYDDILKEYDSSEE